MVATVYERVKKIVVEQLGADEKDVVATASFVDDLGADSLDLVEMIMAMEEAFSTPLRSWRSRMRTRRRSPQSRMPSTTSRTRVSRTRKRAEP